jgi:hypothetical protein
MSTELKVQKPMEIQEIISQIEKRKKTITNLYNVYTEYERDVITKFIYKNLERLLPPPPEAEKIRKDEQIRRCFVEKWVYDLYVRISGGVVEICGDWEMLERAGLSLRSQCCADANISDVVKVLGLFAQRPKRYVIENGKPVLAPYYFKVVDKDKDFDAEIHDHNARRAVASMLFYLYLLGYISL